MFMKDNYDHFSIRKLSVGVASVLIGVSLFGVENHEVYASETVNSGETENNTQENQGNEVKTKEVSAPSDLTDAVQKAKDAGMTVTKNPTNKIDKDEVTASADYANETQKIKNATEKYKTDTEKYNKFNDHSELNNVVKEAKGSTNGVENHPGLKIVQDPDVVKDWKNEKSDDEDQIAKIKDAEKEQADKLKSWKEHKNSSDDSVITDAIKQGLWINSEPDAHLELKSDNPNVGIGGTSSAAIWGQNLGSYTVVPLPTEDIPGKVVTATYTNLSHSYYEDVEGNKHNIGKIVRTFSDYQKNPTDTNGILDIYSDPNNGYWYWYTKSITITDELFDSDGNPINIGKNAWLLAESLNNNYGNHIEKVSALGDSTACAIAGSSVKKDGNTLYSPTETQNIPYDWDKRDSKYSYLGAGLIKLNNSGEKTNSYSVRTWSDPLGEADKWVWVYFSTKLTSNDPDSKMPTTTVHYHNTITKNAAPDKEISYQLISIPDKSSKPAEPTEKPDEKPSTKDPDTKTEGNTSETNVPEVENQGPKSDVVKSDDDTKKEATEDTEVSEKPVIAEKQSGNKVN